MIKLWSVACLHLDHDSKSPLSHNQGEEVKSLCLLHHAAQAAVWALGDCNLSNKTKFPPTAAMKLIDDLVNTSESESTPK
jgi:hypothetical protein